MKKCLAFRNPRGARDAWIPCGRAAAKTSYFCQRHDDAITSAVMGLLVHGFPDAAIQSRSPQPAAGGDSTSRESTFASLDRAIRRREQRSKQFTN